MNIVATYRHTFYDYGALLYLGLRYLLKKYLKISIPKANIWAASGMYTCVEYVSFVTYGEENSLLTPYRLYVKLSST